MTRDARFKARNVRFLAVVAISMASVPASADLADDLGELTGYTIVGSKTIDGYTDENGEKSEDFEGCDFGRIIRFDDGTSARCATYSYTYAYRPTAVLLMKETTVQGHRMAAVTMIVEDETYDMEPVRLR